MRITDKRESAERCTEAGWFAYDYFFDQRLEDAFIVSLRQFGGFLYLKALKEPFFKVENDHWLIKGIKGNFFFRVAVHGDFLNFLPKLEYHIDNFAEEPV